MVVLLGKKSNFIFSKDYNDVIKKTPGFRFRDSPSNFIPISLIFLTVGILVYTIVMD